MLIGIIDAFALLILPFASGVAIVVGLAVILLLKEALYVGIGLLTRKVETEIGIADVARSAIHRSLPTGKLVTISGIDGSGKSTQIELLTEYLGSFDLKVKVRVGRFPAFFVYLVLGIGRLLNLHKRYDIDGTLLSYPDYRRMRPLSIIYEVVMLCDLVFERFRAYVYSALNDVLIYDRFVPDAIVDLTFSTGEEELVEGKSFLGRLYWYLLTSCGPMILLDVPASLALARKKPSIPHEVISKRELFLHLLRHLRGIPVDAANELSVVQDAIKVAFWRGLSDAYMNRLGS